MNNNNKNNNKRAKQHASFPRGHHQPPAVSAARGEYNNIVAPSIQHIPATDTNLLEEHRQALQHGALQSQHMVNEAREQQNLRQWKDTVVQTSISPLGFRQEKQDRGRSTPTTNMQAASDLRQMLRSNQTPVQGSRYPPVGSSEEDHVGPFNFQQFLRKTNYAPTDTIRKRQKEREGKRGSNGAFQ